MAEEEKKVEKVERVEKKVKSVHAASLELICLLYTSDAADE